MDETLKRDQNHITVLAGIENDSDGFIRMLRVDPITKRLLIQADLTTVTVTSFNGLVGAVTISAGTNIQFTTVGNNIQITALNDATAVWGSITGTITTQTDLMNNFLYKPGITGGQTAIGGTGVTDILKLQGTTGNGTLTSPAIQALVGNNGATVAWTVLNNGNMGIGTTSPTNSLSFGNSTTRKIWIEDSATGTSGKALTIAAGGTTAGTLNINGGGLVISSGAGTGAGSSTISFQTGTTLGAVTTLQTLETKMTILGSGNVGIGTTSPGVKLHVVGAGPQLKLENTVATSAVYTQITNTGGNSYFGAENSAGTGLIGTDGLPYAAAFGHSGAYPAQIFTSNAARMTVLANGNIGIGTTNPTHKLQVRPTTDINILFGIGSDDATAGRITTLNDSLALIPMELRASKYNFTIGNVGIGTTAPAESLHIKANETGAGTSLFRLDNGGTISNEVGMEFWTSPSDATSSSRSGRIYSKWDGSSYIDSRLTFQSMTTGNVLVDTMSLKNGNVGIGNTNPYSLLELSKDSANAIATVSSFHDTEATYPALLLRKADGSRATPGAVDDNAIIGAVRFAGYDGDEFIDGALIQGVAEGNASNNVVPGQLRFYTNAGGSSVTERMRIDKLGNVGIGITPTATLHLRAGTATASTAPLKFTSGTLLTNPEAGTMEFLTDKFYLTQTTGDTRKEIKLVDQYYAEMYEYENTNPTTIGTQDVYHAVNDFTAGLLSGFTFTSGIEGSIASVSDYSGTVAGTILITDVAHGLLTGDIITIHATTDYNGTYSITKVTNDTFYVTKAYTSSQTGEWAMGSYLKVATGADGVYRVSMNNTALSANSNEVFKFEMNKNITPLDNTAVSRKFGAAGDYGALASSGLVSLVAGDRVWLSVKNNTSGANITIRHCNVNIKRN